MTFPEHLQPNPRDPMREAKIVDRLEEALLRGGGTHRLADVVRMLRANTAQWWEHGDGVTVTEVVDHPQFRQLNVWLVAGALGDAMAMQTAIERWAREQGVRRIVATGRDGWDRVCCRHMGFRRAGVALERWLDGS